MMRRVPTPVIMGFAMGIMMPLMIHFMGADAGLWFVLAHVAVALALAGIGLLAARLGKVSLPFLRLAHHRPSARHFGWMAVGGVAGLSTVCALCVALFLTGAHTWT